MSDNQNQIPISVTNAHQTLKHHQQQQQQSNLNGAKPGPTSTNPSKKNNNLNNNNLNPNNNINKNNIINNSVSKLTSNENDLYEIIQLDEFQNFLNNQKNLLIDNNNKNDKIDNIDEESNDVVFQENKLRSRKHNAKVLDIITNDNNNNTNGAKLFNVNNQQVINNNLQQHHHQKQHRYESILLKELMQLGIKKEKIEKALAATGYQNSMDAINWLMKHSKDPLLNQDGIHSTRDYILVLCPVGRLANQISTFFQQVKLKCGVNEAHFTNYLPYMKLTPFFKLLDSDVINLHKAFDLIFKPVHIDGQNNLQVINKKARISEINVDLHVSTQMLLLYPDIDSENLIKEIISAFGKLAFKLMKTDYEILPYSKQLHLTLAYNFEAEHKRILEELAIQHLDYRSSSDWEIRLYSRDIRAEGKMTYKVISPNKPKTENELYLKTNDYVFAAPITTIKETHAKGVSFTTGESGFFPVKSVERGVESDTWKQHKSHLLVNNSSQNPIGILVNKNQTSPGQQLQPAAQNAQNQLLSQRTFSAIEKQPTKSIQSTIDSKLQPFFSESLHMQKRFQSMPNRSLQAPGGLRFFFARHGERIDLAFGPQWIEQAFDRNGKYRRINLNMPADLPQRQMKREFIGDSPLTEVGKFQARLTGEALGNEGYKIHYCYASPALRCIQTANQILQAQGLDKLVKIRIEPSVFEFLGWYDKGLPTFLGFDALLDFGYNIDVNYRPLLSVDRLQTEETYADYYQRSFNISKYLTSMHQSEGANILVIGHAGTLEVCTRQICGLPVRSYSEFNATIRKVPYLGICLLEKEAASQSFTIQNAVIPPLGHTQNFNFDPISLKM